MGFWTPYGKLESLEETRCQRDRRQWRSRIELQYNIFSNQTVYFNQCHRRLCELTEIKKLLIEGF